MTGEQTRIQTRYVRCDDTPVWSLAKSEPQTMLFDCDIAGAIPPIPSRHCCGVNQTMWPFWGKVLCPSKATPVTTVAVSTFARTAELIWAQRCRSVAMTQY